MSKLLYIFLAFIIPFSSTTIIPNINPVADAGLDQTFDDGRSYTDLWGGFSTDADGTIVSYAWTRISGPNTPTMSSPNAMYCRLTGVVAGTYVYRLTVTDNTGATDQNDVSITVVTYTINNAAPVSYNVTTTSSGEIWRPTTVGSTYGCKGGDTLKIAAGTYDLIALGGFHGDKNRPIVIVNSGGVVNVGQFRLGALAEASYIKIISANGVGTYGWKVGGHPVYTNAAFAGAYVHNMEVYGMELTGSGVGMYFKVEPNSSDKSTWFPMFVLNKMWFHDCYIHKISGEGMYIGHSYPNADPYNGNAIPCRADSVEISNMIVDSTDWDGIQLSNARNYGKIHHNTVTNYGLSNIGGQQAGILSGGNTNCDEYYNVVKYGTGNGMQNFGYGVHREYNNYFDSCGYDGTLNGQQAYFGNSANITIENDNPAPQDSVYSNCVKYPKTGQGVMRINNDASTMTNVWYRATKVWFATTPSVGWETSLFQSSATTTTRSGQIQSTNMDCADPAPTPSNIRSTNYFNRRFFRLIH